jgi:hypothetical protein
MDDAVLNLFVKKRGIARVITELSPENGNNKRQRNP